MFFLSIFGGILINKYFKYIIIYIGCFILSANICFNLTSIIKNNIKITWTFNLIKTTLAIYDFRLFFGTFLLSLIFILCILSYDKELRKLFNTKKEMPKADGSFEYGSSRWATKKEIKKKYKVWNFGNKLKGGGIPVTSIDGKVYYSDEYDHSLIIGSTGSGKTQCEILPMIYNLGFAGESMVINDTKGELYSYTSNFLKEQGYIVKVINLRDALASDGWNPLHLPYKYFKNGNIDLAGDLIENFAKSLTRNLSGKDMYWEKSTNAVLTALCYAIIEDAPSEDQVHLYSIYNLLVEHGAKSIDRYNSLDLYFQQKPFGNIAKNAYATGSFAKGETRATLFSVLATVIKMFSDVGIANLTSRTDFELDSIGKQKTCVFLVIPDEKESRHELASLFIDQCYQALINTAQSLPSGKMPIRVNFILDEFSSMPPINMSTKISVSRSRNIRFTLVIQDFDQLKEKYKEQAGTIKSNCTNWIYLLTADNETAREVSARLGKYTTVSKRTSTSARINETNYNVSNDSSLIGRELIMPDELMRLKFGEAIFMGSRSYPIKASIMPVGKYPFKIKFAELPNEPKEYEISCFDLDKYREERSEELVDLE